MEMLKQDLVSSGIIAQLIEDEQTGGIAPRGRLKQMLSELLSSGRIEVGGAKLAGPDYVEFVAWNGTCDDRVTRAIDAVSNAISQDKEFAFWLCLRENVDRFEVDE